jgi:hypothetical protein
MARAGTIVERINDFTYEAGAMKLPERRLNVKSNGNNNTNVSWHQLFYYFVKRSTTSSFPSPVNALTG